MSKFKGVKTDNAKITAKHALRSGAVSMLASQKTHVLEVFCGKGEMYEAVWSECNSYLGIDKRKFQDKRAVLIGDAMSALLQVNCSEYNIFDIDAYGSPYECLAEIVKQLEQKNKHKRIAFCITDGVQMDLRMGNITLSMACLSGINVKKISRAHKLHDVIIARIIDHIASRLHCNVIDKKIAIGATGSGMRYYSFVIEKTD